jgi:hypothetical protein
MLMELAKPVTFILCILSLYALFINAFLVPSNDMYEKICDCLGLLMLAAGAALISGLSFSRAASEPYGRPAQLLDTLPVRLFCWASSIMVVLFIVAWYLETHCVFYRDVRL